MTPKEETLLTTELIITELPTLAPTGKGHQDEWHKAVQKEFKRLKKISHQI